MRFCEKLVIVNKLVRWWREELEKKSIESLSFSRGLYSGPNHFDTVANLVETESKVGECLGTARANCSVIRVSSLFNASRVWRRDNCRGNCKSSLRFHSYLIVSWSAQASGASPRCFEVSIAENYEITIISLAGVQSVEYISRNEDPISTNLYTIVSD